MEKTVIELFAGVGGFRVGLNNITQIDENGKAIENKKFNFVWANQWEPSTKIQHAYDCYKLRFDDNASNVDISLIDKKTIPNHSLLCGGFPCQDYSVARSLSNEKGIEGKKGVLWWQIRDILAEKNTPFVLLENVDRLTKSPAKQRGRDFGIMIRCLTDLGYNIEWRVINAAEYGFPQRRRRIYIFAYKNSTNYYAKQHNKNPLDMLKSEGLFAKTFPIQDEDYIVKTSNLYNYVDLIDMSNNYAFGFENSGIVIEGNVYTIKSIPVNSSPITLRDIIENEVEESFYLNEDEIKKFEFLRGHKVLERISKDGHKYNYSEGAMSPYDYLDLPGRTMLTSEGSVNRSTHIIKDDRNGKLRILTPIECERLNQFPDNWTNSGMPIRRRYFMMGNALVCGIINKIGNYLSELIDNE